MLTEGRYSKKDKRKLLRIIDETMKSFGIRNYLIYGSFVKRKYFRDIDIAIVDKVNESKLTKLWDELEKKLGVEVDLRRYEELPEPIKFLAFCKGIRRLSKRKTRHLMRFAYVYMDVAEWLKKWL